MPAWNKLQSKDEWKDKGYFYYGDEVWKPSDMEKYYRDTNAHLTSLIGTGFRQIAVIGNLQYYDKMSQIDIVDFINPYVGIWCTLSNSYTMYGDSHKKNEVKSFNDTRRYKYYGMTSGDRPHSLPRARRQDLGCISATHRSSRMRISS